MIVVIAHGANEAGFYSTAIPGKERLTGLVGANHLTGVEIQASRNTNCAAGDIARLRGPVLAQITLDGEVVIKDVAALELIASCVDRIVGRNQAASAAIDHWIWQVRQALG